MYIRKISLFIMTSALILLLTSCGSNVDKVSYESSESQISQNLDMLYSESNTETTEQIITEPTEPVTVPIEKPADYVLPDSHTLDVECIMQNPELPTGCEVTSLAIALNYHGFEVDKVELCDEFLFKDYYAYHTFEEAYIGNPKAKNGFGCYAPVIVDTAEKYFNSAEAQWYAKDLSGTEFEDLFYQIEQGRPVVIWTSMDLNYTELTLRWTTEDGDEAWFADYEHCMVLSGYDKTQDVVYVADPLKGNMVYSLSRFKECYGMLNKRAVVLCEGEKPETYNNTLNQEANND